MDENTDGKTPSNGGHIVLTSHREQIFSDTVDINWGAKTPTERGPVIGAASSGEKRNAIGSHSGSYTIYRALSIASGSYPKDHRPDLHNTNPTVGIGPYESWTNPKQMVSIDPWGSNVHEFFKKDLDAGVDVRPTIAVTQAYLTIPEVQESVRKGTLLPDGEHVKENGELKFTKVAFEPVWYWTSTQVGEAYAWIQSFYNGYQFSCWKSNSSRARAVRTINLSDLTI